MLQSLRHKHNPVSQMVHPRQPSVASQDTCALLSFELHCRHVQLQLKHKRGRPNRLPSEQSPLTMEVRHNVPAQARKRSRHRDVGEASTAMQRPKTNHATHWECVCKRHHLHDTPRSEGYYTTWEANEALYTKSTHPLVRTRNQSTKSLSMPPLEVRPCFFGLRSERRPTRPPSATNLWPAT